MVWVSGSEEADSHAKDDRHDVPIESAEKGFLLGRVLGPSTKVIDLLRLDITFLHRVLEIIIAILDMAGLSFRGFHRGIDIGLGLSVYSGRHRGVS